MRYSLCRPEQLNPKKTIFLLSNGNNLQVTRPKYYANQRPPSLGDYSSPEALFEALRAPLINFTVLVPPLEQLEFLPVALEHELMTHADALEILLLHIIPGGFSARDLGLAAHDEQCASPPLETTFSEV